MLSRRDFLKNSLLLSGYLLVGERFVHADTIDDSAVKAVSLNVTYITEILNPPKRKDIKIWIPLPYTDAEQEIQGMKIESRLPYEIMEDKGTGNRMLFFRTDYLRKGDSITMRFRFRRKASGIIEDRDADPQRYLRPSEWERWDARITEFVSRLVGDERDPVRVGRKIYDAIISRLKYIHEICGRGVSTITFEEGLGRCDEFHALFRSMMMLRSIPVRWEQGIAFPYPSEIKKRGEFEADCINAHSWVRFYVGQGRWFPVDVSEAKRRPDLREYYFGRLVPNRIKVSTGRGLTLSPPQKGIINTFAYTYIEAGGLPVIYGHNYRNRIRYELIGIET